MPHSSPPSRADTPPTTAIRTTRSHCLWNTAFAPCFAVHRMPPTKEMRPTRPVSHQTWR